MQACALTLLTVGECKSKRQARRRSFAKGCVRGALRTVLPSKARVRATRGTAEYRSAKGCGPSMRRRVRPREWRLSAPAARMQAMRGQASNPSIERTPKSQLRCLSVAAHVER